MNDRRGDPGFSVAPRRIGDGPRARGPRRGRRLGILLVLGAAAGVIGIAWLGPRITQPPRLDLSYFATPTPDPSASATPSAGAPSPGEESIGPVGPTPLPEVTRPEGANTDPNGRVAIAADGVRILDLASGQLEKGADFALGIDAVVRAPDDRGWSCVCVVDDLIDGQPVRIVKVTAIGPTGAQFDSFDVLTVPASFGDEFGQTNPLLDVDVDDDGRSGLLAIAARTGDEWSIKVASIDIDRRQAGAEVELGRVSVARQTPASPPPASPGPTPQSASASYLDGPHVRIAPGGRVAFVWVVVQTNSEDAVVTTAVHAWRIAIDAGGNLGEVRPIDGLDGLPTFCIYATFAAADRFAWFCPRFSSDASQSEPGRWVLGTVDLDGRAAGSRTIDVHENATFSEPIVDRANGWMYAWDPTALVLTRLNVHALDSTSVTFDAAAAAAPGIATGGGTDPPDWRDADSAVELMPYRQIAADDSRLYVVAFDQLASPEAATQGSLGIFVVERATLALVDRWAPAADYLAVSVDRLGQILAIGVPGVDATGREAPWQGSLTVHDPADGRVLVRYGQLGQDNPPLVFDR